MSQCAFASHSLGAGRNAARFQTARSLSGYTLLEVVLALSLTVVVMSAIGMAIHLHLRSVDTTRTAIERDQLARTLMRRIGDDVRSAVRKEPFDDSGLQSLMGAAKNAASALAGAAGGGAGGSGAGGSSSGSPSNGGTRGTGTTGTARSTGTTTAAGTTQSLSGSGSSATTGDDAAAEAGTPAAVAGLYGTATELQIDIARVPRPDEFAEAMIAGGLPPSDVKTVYYFLAQSGVGLASGGETIGLMRSEMNRATALFASQNGDYQIFTQNAQSLAPEVIGLQFRYYDGLEWFTEWSSQDRNGLPMAIEIALVIADPTNANQPLEAGAIVDPTMDDVDPELIYHTVVHLPNAQLTQASTASGDTSQSGDSSTSQGSTGSGSGASGASGSSGQSSGGMTK